ncbi:hotdog domain-containing protein [Amaricoccus sp. B4]|uniref:hotdog domain-containing protein n=1 Tax=Amaricoccus sp. B4 TaxID=3368557 RepID=UPI00371D962B
MTFHCPLKVGDEVSLQAELERAGETSMQIWVAAWRREHNAEERHLVTEASSTFASFPTNVGRVWCGGSLNVHHQAI